MNGSIRKRLVGCLCIVCVFAAGLAVFVWLSPKLRVSQETFSQIRRQMTEAEIEDLLGGRGSKRDSKTALGLAQGEGVFAAWTDDSALGKHETLRYMAWRTPDKCIKVGFDADGRAVYAILTLRPEGVSLWEKLRWWIGI